jgi:hypothetical protein
MSATWSWGWKVRFSNPRNLRSDTSKICISPDRRLEAHAEQIARSGAPTLATRTRPIDGSGRVKMDAGRLRTRGHIDVGHRPEVPFEDRAAVA